MAGNLYLLLYVPLVLYEQWKCFVQGSTSINILIQILDSFSLVNIIYTTNIKKEIKYTFISFITYELHVTKSGKRQLCGSSSGKHHQDSLLEVKSIDDRIEIITSIHYIIMLIALLSSMNILQQFIGFSLGINVQNIHHPWDQYIGMI